MIDTTLFFHDEAGDFVCPPEPEPGESMRLVFRTSVADDLVVEIILNNETKLMPRVRIENGFSYFELSFEAPCHELRYLFHIFEFESPRDGFYYDMRGTVTAPDDRYRFRVIPGFSTPDWAKGAVMYQIFTDRFCNGDDSNDVRTGEYVYGDEPVKHVDKWDSLPDPTDDFREFYGGDLQGVIDKLDYLQTLGVEVIYFNPLFISPSSHKYDTQDYDHIDPHFGRIVNNYPEYRLIVSDEDNLRESDLLFARLVELAHERGIRVILDGVFNHCGSFNKWMDSERFYQSLPGYAPGAYVSGSSPYRNFFSFHSDNWPYNSDYDGWWGYQSLPKLNYEGSKQLEDYIIGIGRKWVSPPYNADGWRLDVAEDLGHSSGYNHYFWKRFRSEVKKANPDALILAEHYGDAGAWLSGSEWDSVMNYDAFMEPVSFLLTGMEKHSDEYHPYLTGDTTSFYGTMLRVKADNFSYPSLYTAMNELSNHDHSRFLTRTNHCTGRSEFLGAAAANAGVSRPVMRLAVMIQMTWPGAPTVYYGDEAGLCGFTDPDDRRSYPWGYEDREMLAYHHDIIHIHKSCQELKTGSMITFDISRGLIAYARFSEKDGVTLVLINLNDHETVFAIPLKVTGIPRDAIFTQLIQTNTIGYVTDPITYRAADGELIRVVGRTSGVIMRYDR